MAFLTTTDYDKLIESGILDIVKGDAATLADAEVAAQEEMASYLRGRYDVNAIFAATGTDRNPVLVLYMADMVLYHIHSRIAPMNIPELRGIRYDAAIGWLKRVADGKLNPDLPLLDETEDLIGNVRYGNINDKQKTAW